MRGLDLTLFWVATLAIGLAGSVNGQPAEPGRSTGWIKKTFYKPFSSKSSSPQSSPSASVPSLTERNATSSGADVGDGVARRDFALTPKKKAAAKKTSRDATAAYYMDMYAKQYGLSGKQELEALASLEEMGRRSSIPLANAFPSPPSQAGPSSRPSYLHRDAFYAQPSSVLASSGSSSGSLSYFPTSSPFSLTQSMPQSPSLQSHVTPPPERADPLDAAEDGLSREEKLVLLRRALKGKAKLQESGEQGAKMKSHSSSVDSMDIWLARHLLDEGEDGVRYTRLGANNEPLPSPLRQPRVRHNSYQE